MRGASAVRNRTGPAAGATARRKLTCTSKPIGGGLDPWRGDGLQPRAQQRHAERFDAELARLPFLRLAQVGRERVAQQDVIGSE